MCTLHQARMAPTLDFLRDIGYGPTLGVAQCVRRCPCGRRSRSPGSPPPLLPPAESPEFVVIRAPPQLQPVAELMGSLGTAAPTLPANVLARLLCLARPPPSHRAVHVLQGEQHARTRQAASHAVERSAARRRAARLLQPAQATARRSAPAIAAAAVQLQVVDQPARAAASGCFSASATCQQRGGTVRAG